MRLIDADELKKDFRLNFGGVSHAAAAAEIIDRQPTIDPESLRPHGKWVSVEDRLPEPGERVLATDCGFVGEFYINKRGKWQRYNVNCSELLMALDILYWTPLPAPPADVTEEMTSIICGAEESGMNIAEYAEYITGKADECRARLEGNP